MSTRAIRECLEYMRHQHGSGTMEDALVEVDAIERAAKVVAKDKHDEYVMQGELESAYELIESIARDAP